MLLGPEGGLLGTYRKNSVWPGEAHLYSPGEEMSVFETPHGNIGIMICFDRMQPDAIEELDDPELTDGGVVAYFDLPIER